MQSRVVHFYLTEQWLSGRTVWRNLSPLPTMVRQAHNGSSLVIFITDILRTETA